MAKRRLAKRTKKTQSTEESDSDYQEPTSPQHVQIPKPSSTNRPTVPEGVPIVNFQVILKAAEEIESKYSRLLNIGGQSPTVRRSPTRDVGGQSPTVRRSPTRDVGGQSPTVRRSPTRDVAQRDKDGSEAGGQSPTVRRSPTQDVAQRDKDGSEAGGQSPTVRRSPTRDVAQRDKDGSEADTDAAGQFLFDTSEITVETSSTVRTSDVTSDRRTQIRCKDVYSVIAFDKWCVNCQYAQSPCLILEQMTKKAESPERSTEVRFEEKVLTQNQENKIRTALEVHSGNRLDVIATSDDFRHTLTKTDLRLLLPEQWLTDKVINYYLQLIELRGKEEQYPSVTSLSTFLYGKLKTDYLKVKTWIKSDIFVYDYILIPVHVNRNHWCLAVIDFKTKRIRYFDSLGGSAVDFQALRALLNDESLRWRKQAIDWNAWKDEVVQDIPQQHNTNDCGVFVCMYAEYITRNETPIFSQDDMDYFRKRMVLEIINNKLL